MGRALPTWIGRVWIAAGIAAAVGEYAFASPYTIDAVLAATLLMICTTGPMLAIGWGLAARRSAMAGSMGAVLGIGVTTLAVVVNAVDLGTPPPVETLIVGGVGVALGVGAWMAHLAIIGEMRPSSGHRRGGF